MTGLAGAAVSVAELTASDRDAMFAIMDLVYEGTTRDAFERDLAAKDTCIVLRADGRVAGFSTQRTLTVDTPDGDATGVFSGDTVVHPDHWGSPVLSQVFARTYILDRPDPFWWFLLSKGHRTYRFLPTFFVDYWPSRRGPTPASARAIMDAYASALYGDDYDAAAGVVAYRTPKDRLRPGVAGVTERDLVNPDVAFFAAANPAHAVGHDLVCLTDLRPGNVKPRTAHLLFG